MFSPRFVPSSPPLNGQPRSTSVSSTAPRHPSNLGPNANGNPRPQFSPRSSSLNLSAKANSSSTNLNSPRHSGAGSALRQEVLPSSDGRDPLTILEDIVGSPLPNLSRADVVLNKPKILVHEIDFGSLGLDEFAAGSENGEDDNDQKYGQPIEEHEQEKEKFEDLHESITACDNVLKSVESSLASFQKDLGTVSAEIETLQNRSNLLNTKLENRKIVEKLLGPAVEKVAIPPTVIRKVAEGFIDSEWISALAVVDNRSKAIEQESKTAERMKAMSDIKPILEDLINIAIEKIRDFFVSQIKALRSPNINAQVIQQRAFLAHRDLYAFMLTHQSQLAEEIAQAYSNTMRWYYLSSFTRYVQSLERIPVYGIDKSEALGFEPSMQRAPLTGSTGPPKASNPLSLGRRLDALTRPNQSAMPSHIAGDTKAATYLETPFYALSTALTDNASSEYAFLTSFFPNTMGFPAISRTFNRIFSSTFELGHSFTKQLIENSHDCLGLLLCVRITQHHAFSLQRRKCPVADGWINGTNMLLWPRFQVGMDAQIESVKRATLATSSGSRATLSLAGGKSDDGKGSTAPHPLTQRFAQLLQGILALSNDDVAATQSFASASGAETAAKSSDSEPVGRSLDRLRNEVEAFLAKLAKGLNPGRRDRFLANNYSLILTIIGETGGSLAREQREWFEEKKESVGGS